MKNGISCAVAMAVALLSAAGAGAQEERPIHGAPNWSPDGTRIIFTSKPSPDALAALWTMAADGADARMLFADSDASYNSPDYSPDGEWIAAVKAVRGLGDLVLIDSRGLGETLLTDNPHNERMPSWSRDGRSVYYSRRPTDGAGPSRVYRMERATGAVSDISGDRWSEIYPRVAPDGRRLMTTGRVPDGPFNQILLRAHDGAEPVDLTRRTVPNYNAAWSPDGHRIAFVSHTDDDDPYAALFIMNADGSGLGQVTAFREGSYGPKWSPDGTTILFRVGWDDVHVGLFTLDVASGETRQLTNVEFGGAS